MKLSFLFISAIFLVLSFSGMSRETVMNTITRHVRGKLNKVVQSFGDTVATGYKRMTVVVGARGVPKPKNRTHQPKRSKTPTHKQEKKRLPKEQPTNTTFIATDELLSAQWYSGIPANSTKQAPNKYAKSKTRESKRTMLASNPLPLPIATTIIPVRSHTPYPIYFSDGSSRKGLENRGSDEYRGINARRVSSDRHGSGGPMGSLEKRGSYESSSSEEERTQATKKTTSPERTGSFEKRISLIQTMPAIEQRLADKREDESAQPLKVEYSEPIRILNPTTETAEIAKLAEYAESAESVESAEFAKSADTVESSETLVAAKSTTKSKEIQTNTKEVTFKKVEDSKQ